MELSIITCFFFQAEDGIRDLTVTGVQTCALPIYRTIHSATQHGFSLPSHSTEQESTTSRASTQSRMASKLKRPDRKSTRLNSSHSQISYAVFCLKKKKIPHTQKLHDARAQTCQISD